jgi:hypothetical protein
MERRDMELTYTVRAHDTGPRGQGVRFQPTETATGIVWSPGPLPQTVWVLPHAGASGDLAVVVHAPTSTRPDWHRVEYAPPTFTAPWRMRDAETEARWCAEREAEHYRAAHHAPPLPPKVWRMALGWS